MTGRHLSQYIVGEKLGEGGMGVVYVGTDTRLNRQVALKFLTKSLPLDAAERKRLLREARAASAINHPNVCTVHAIEEVEGEEFLVMEFVEGLTLRKWAVHKKEELRANALPVKNILGIAVQVAQGLDAAHKKGIVHRDIKPENVMVTDDGRAKIMDFGLAKLAGESRITRPGSAVGTIAYMSPEQVQGKEIDLKSDIYSFGVMLYDLLAGTIPFKADNAVGMMYAIVNANPTPLRQIQPVVDPRLEQIVMKCMARAKEDRYSAMRDVIRDLMNYGDRTRTIVANAPPGFFPGKRLTGGRFHSGTRPSMKIILWSAIVILGVIGVAVFVMWHTSSSDALLTVFSSPPGSKVFINGAEAGTTPLNSYRLPAGRTRVQLQLGGYLPADTTVEMRSDQAAILEASLRPLEAKGTDKGEGRGAKSDSSAQIAERQTVADTTLRRFINMAESVDALASSIIMRLYEKSPSVRGVVAVLPFTVRMTEVGSEFSRYFRSILESRASSLPRWSIISTKEGNGGMARRSADSAEFEIAGTYWELPKKMRFIAALRNIRTSVVVAQTEADIAIGEIRKLDIPWLPENIRRVMDDGKRLGNPIAGAADLNLELFTNKGEKNLVFAQGDTLAISARVNKPCILRAFYHAADGHRYVLTGEHDMTIDTSGVSTIVPILTVECAPPFGAEILQVFASAEKFESIPLRLADNGFFELRENVENAMIATRGIKRIGGGPRPVERRMVVTTVAKQGVQR